MKNINKNKSLAVIRFIACAVLAALCVVGCKDDFTSPSSPTGSTITAIANDDADLDIFSAALVKTNQAGTLDNNNSGTFTVFAPSDSAFVAYFQSKLTKPAYTEDSVLNYINTKMTVTSAITIANLNTLLIYHIVTNGFVSTDLHNGQVVTPLSGSRLSVSKQGSRIVLNGNLTTTLGGLTGAKSTAVDIIASNGVLDKINRVIFAPTIATVVSILGVSVNNGVVPPAITVSPTASNYNIFANALAVTVLADTLVPNVSPAPDFTLFVPDDASFVTYLKGLSGSPVTDEASAITFVKSLGSATTPTLANFTQMIRYHVLKGRFLSTDFTPGQTVTTLSAGNTFTVDFPANKLHDKKGNDITISATRDQVTGVGVLHMINGVLQLQ